MKILLGVTGSVAAIHTPKLIEALSALGEVRTIVTDKAAHFIEAPVPCFRERDEWRWRQTGDHILHIDLRLWADVLVLAPLTANSLAKIAHGISDNLLTSVVRAWDYTKPLILVPAMNNLVWDQPMTRHQLKTMTDMGAEVIAPVAKPSTYGDTGEGAMADIATIVRALEGCNQK